MKTAKYLLKWILPAGLGCLGLSPSSLAEYAYEADRSEVETEVVVKQSPIFPLNLIQAGYTEGKVSMVVEIDQHGELRDYLIVFASHRDFGRAVEYVIDTWDFTPPKWKGQPISIVRSLEVFFKSKGVFIEFDLSSGLFNRIFNKDGSLSRDKYKIAEVDDLDSFPQIIESQEPLISEEVLLQAQGKEAVFTFYVDTKGNVRMPALSEADDDINAVALVAAQDAISQWKFAKPTVNGRPVVIQLAQPFYFNPSGMASR